MDESKNSNLYKILEICADPDFDFTASSLEDSRTPIARILAFANIDPQYNLGLSYVSFHTELKSFTKVIRSFPNLLSGEPRRIDHARRTIDSAHDDLFNNTYGADRAGFFASASTKIAKDLLEIAISKTTDINAVFNDERHQYLTEIHNLELIDFLIDNGLNLFWISKSPEIPSPSVDGMKFAARLFYAETQLVIGKPLRPIAEEAIVKDLKTYLTTSIKSSDIFFEDNERYDAVEFLTLFTTILSDKSLKSLLEFAQRQGYSLRQKSEDGQTILGKILEDILSHLDSQRDIKIPIETIKFLIGSELALDEDDKANLQNIEQMLINKQSTASNSDQRSTQENLHRITQLEKFLSSHP